MNSAFWKLALGALVLASGWTVAKADVARIPNVPWSKSSACDPRELCIRVSNGIVSGDDLALKELIDAKPSLLRLQVELDTIGGDVETALNMGRLFRASKAQTHVRKCASSCLFLVAGATHRPGTRGLVIHRPYPVEADNLEWSERQAQYRKWKRAILDYLLEMNIPDAERLVAEMEKVPPESERVLSQSEIEYFLLDGTDPAMLEQEDMEDARHYGLSNVEYLRRKARAESECEWSEPRNQATRDVYDECRWAIFEGK